MLEFIRRETNTRQEKGPSTTKVEYLYNDHPICIYVAAADHSMTQTDVRLRTKFVKPNGPTVPGETSEYVFVSKDGREIDDVAFYNVYTIQQIVGQRHYTDEFPGQERVTIPEDSSVIGCLGITVPVNDEEGKFLWYWRMPLADYLLKQKEESQDAEQPESAS